MSNETDKRDLRAEVIFALSKWINQRPRLEPRNYGDAASYRAESRRITRDKHDAAQLLHAVNWREISAERIVKAAHNACMGRLEIVLPGEVGDYISGVSDKVRIGYCTGQYWPTEYRRAVCAVLAAALWTYTRERKLPTPVKVPGSTDRWYRWNGVEPLSMGDWLRRYFQRELGRGIVDRWFK